MQDWRAGSELEDTGIDVCWGSQHQQMKREYSPSCDQSMSRQSVQVSIGPAEPGSSFVYKTQFQRQEFVVIMSGVGCSQRTRATWLQKDSLAAR